MKLPILFVLIALASPARADPAPAGSSTIASTVCADDDEVCKAEARRHLEAIPLEPNLGLGGDGQPTDAPSLAFMFFKMLLTLGAVCLLAYLSLGKLLPKILRVQAPIAGHRIMHVVDRLPIDQRRSVMIIKTGEQLYFLIGVTEHGISLLSRLDSDDVDTALATVAAEPPRLGRFAQALMGRSGKES